MVIPSLYAGLLASWTFVGGALIAARRRGKLGRQRRALAWLSPMWVMFGALWLWRTPAITPLWLQYLLIVAVPAIIGYATSSVRARRRALNAPAVSPADPAGGDDR